VNPKKISSKLGSCTKLAAKFYGSFEIFNIIGLVSYMIAFSASNNLHNIFHVSLMKKYVHDPNNIIRLEFDSHAARTRFSGPFSAHIGNKIQNTMESSHRTIKHSFDQRLS
jgi:hypothetical protein